MNLGHLYTSFDGRINRASYWIGTIILVPILVYAWEPVKAQLGR